MTKFEQEQTTWIKSARFSDLNGCPQDSQIWLVLRKIGKEYVIHRFSSLDCGYSSGIYKRLKSEAIAAFETEAKAIRGTVANNSEIIEQLNTIIDVMEIKRADFVDKLQQLEATGYPQMFYHSQLNEINNTIKLLIESRDKLAALNWIS